jgi:hypothetical protein
MTENLEIESHRACSNLLTDSFEKAVRPIDIDTLIYIYGSFPAIFFLGDEVVCVPFLA